MAVVEDSSSQAVPNSKSPVDIAVSWLCYTDTNDTTVQEPGPPPCSWDRGDECPSFERVPKMGPHPP
jgi:hypothetical protein